MRNARGSRSAALFTVSAVLVSTCLACANGAATDEEPLYPGRDWTRWTPDQMGVSRQALDQARDYLGGRGCVVVRGALIYSWGDIARRGDVASACKPWYTHFLLESVERGRIAGFDERVARWEPRLDGLKAEQSYPDRVITWRQLANQTSCYGISEAPGAAFDYNDWQTALFFDTLFLKVHDATHESMDADVLRPLLTDVLQCQDEPTLLAFGPRDRPGRLAVSVRDFARFGLLYLQQGNWNGKQLVSREHARMVVSSPLANSLPRAQGEAVAMIAGQRSIGSTDIPDNQTDHLGSYSWLWWTNGADREGNRLWPHAPPDTFAALGHRNGKRGMAVVPEMELIISWNDTTLDERPWSPPSAPHPLDHVFQLLAAEVSRSENP